MIRTPMPMDSRYYSNSGSVIVIGAGIIGLSTAYYLHQEGFKVTILEQGDLTSNCSSGNAGMIVPSHFVPLAAPGMISKGIKWMFNSRSPFYVKPSLNPALLSWGIKFWNHANAKHVEESAVPLRDLHLFSKQLYDDLTLVPGMDFGLEKKGILMLFKKESTAEEEIHLAEKARQLGLDIAVLSAQETQLLEPDTRLNISGAVHYRCDAHLSPAKLVQQLAAWLTRNGVEIITRCKVDSFRIEKGRIKSLYASGTTYEADTVVMTGGAWLPELARKAGLRIPVMPGKGYSFMAEAHHRVHHPALLLEAKVALTPMDGKIRFGGTMEIAPVQHRIHMNRVEGIVNAIPDYYPDYKMAMPPVKDIWYGFRPCSPDGLPYLGASRKITNLMIAGGHGMMGVSLAPASGKLIAELVAGKTLSVSMDAFRPERF